MGSDHSGEDMEAGRTNRAEDRTRIWAQRTDSDDGDDFNGEAIFIAEVAGDVDDPSDFVGNDWKPQHPVHGVIGSGWRSGIGVVGNGGAILGTGVLGRGGGVGSGGIGVHGVGGNGALQTLAPGGAVEPGPGTLGQGGKQDDFDDKRKPHAAGVIGLAGGIDPPAPAETGNVGVYGQGGNAISRTVSSDGVLAVAGPKDPGPGLLAKGGIQLSDGGILNGPLTPSSDPVGVGVIGLGGGVTLPAFSETNSTGVFGQGSVGVKGVGDAGAGVLGRSHSFEGVRGIGEGPRARGGVFETKRAAQVQLVPHDDGTQPRLPKDGQAGDLLATIVSNERQRTCVLYFCVQGASASTAAQWAPVLLGTLVPGTV